MQYVLVLVFWITFFVFNSGYSITSPFYTHFTYMFSHASWLHIILNTYVFMVMYRVVKPYVKHLWLVIILIAFLASFLVEYSLPTMGASGMVYSMIGMFLWLVVSKVVSFPKRKNLILFIVSIILSFLISYFKESSATLLHFYCMVLGFVYSFLNYTI